MHELMHGLGPHDIDVDGSRTTVRQALREDQEDLAAFEDRAAEPVVSYEALLKDLKAHGKL